MIVDIGGKIYDIGKKHAIGLLKVASKTIEHGIYAVEMNNVQIMLKEEYNDKYSLKKAVEDYKKKGFKVHWK